MHARRVWLVRFELDPKALAADHHRKPAAAIDMPGRRLARGEEHPANQQVRLIGDGFHDHKSNGTPPIRAIPANFLTTVGSCARCDRRGRPGGGRLLRVRGNDARIRGIGAVTRTVSAKPMSDDLW